jgi:hypothetical protein
VAAFTFADYHRSANASMLTLKLGTATTCKRLSVWYTEELVHYVLKQVLFNDLRQLSDRIKELL